MRPADGTPPPYKVDDFVRVVRPHSEGVTKDIGRVLDVRRWGGHWRVTVKTKRGRLDLDPRVIEPIDPIEALASLA